MAYKFDNYGWYDGEAEGDRTTPIAPTNTSRTTTPGQMRANFTGYNWVDLPYVVPTAPQPAVVDSKISVGALFDRFGAQKLAILASSDQVVQAIIKDTSVRQFIDLSRPDVSQVIDLLISKGFTVDKSVILSTDVAEHERP